MARRTSLLLDAACAAGEADTIADLGRDALPLLGRALGAAETMLYGLDAQGRPTPYGGSFREVFQTYARQYLPRDPQQEALISYNPSIARMTGYVDYGAFRRTDVYRKAYRDFGVEYLVQCRLAGKTYVSSGMTALALFRRRNQADWAPIEGRALERVLPAFRAAVRRSGALRAEPVVEAIVEASDPLPRCALDERGRLLWASPRAASLLGLDVARSCIPDALIAAARGLGEETTDEESSGRVVEVTIGTGKGAPLRAELRAARTSDGRLFVSVAIKDFAEPSDALKQLARRAHLTPSETKVLAVLSLGLPNREIARLLFISTETVRTHVARILHKLGVHTRFEAILRVRDAPGVTAGGRTSP